MEEPLSQSERPPPDSSSAGNGAGSFECNICLDLARDPVVTLCGHLFCWPCLYQWLHGHVAVTAAQECPVCKAAVEEEKVVPLYGRGNSSPADPREKKSVPSASEEEVQIPHRPMGQRPETARPAHNNYFHQGFGNFMGGGGAPANSARFGNVTFSAGFGFFPSLFGLQLHDYPNGGAGLGIGTAYPFGMHMGWPHGYRTIRPPPPPLVGRRQEAILSKLLLLLGILVILLIIFF